VSGAGLMPRAASFVHVDSRPRDLREPPVAAERTPGPAPSWWTVV